MLRYALISGGDGIMMLKLNKRKLPKISIPADLIKSKIEHSLVGFQQIVGDYYSVIIKKLDWAKRHVRRPPPEKL